MANSLIGSVTKRGEKKSKRAGFCFVENRGGRDDVTLTI